jgi:hypothetical protein
MRRTTQIRWIWHKSVTYSCYYPLGAYELEARRASRGGNGESKHLPALRGSSIAKKRV